MDESPLHHRSSGVRNGDMFRRDETPYLADEEQPSSHLGVSQEHDGREEATVNRILQSAANAMVQVADYPGPSRNHPVGNAVNGTANGVTGRRAANIIGHAGHGSNNVDPHLIDPALFGLNPAQHHAQPSASTGIPATRVAAHGAYGHNGYTQGTTPPGHSAANNQTSPMAIEETVVFRNGGVVERTPGGMQASADHNTEQNSPAYPSPDGGQGPSTPLRIHEMPNLPGSWSHSSTVARAHMIVIRLQGENLVKTAEHLLDMLRDSMSILRMRADQASFIYWHSTRSDGTAAELWPEYVREIQRQYGAIRDCQWAALRSTTQTMKQWLEKYPEVVLPAVSERGNQVMERMARFSEQLEGFRFPDRDRIASERAQNPANSHQQPR